MNVSKNISATQWRPLYFAGISKQRIDKINLEEAQIAALLSMINIDSGISSGTAIEIPYLINEKGVTAWSAMYALIVSNDEGALPLIAEGKKRAHIPSDFIRNVYKEHINWPADMLAKYDMSLGKYRPFAIPFLVHQSVGGIENLTESLKAPDGSLEIFGVYEFSESDPEALLKNYAELTTFIKTERPDAIR